MHLRPNKPSGNSKNTFI
jgi:hypothetical protein